MSERRPRRKHRLIKGSDRPLRPECQCLGCTWVTGRNSDYCEDCAFGCENVGQPHSGLTLLREVRG